MIDFSEASRDALKAAVGVAGSTGSRLSVLYPYRLNQPRTVPDVATWKKSIDADANSSFNRMTINLFKDSNVLWEFKSEVGFINDRVEAFTQKHNVGLVVMSSELSKNSNEKLEGMIDKLTCPLLIVPKNIESISSLTSLH